MKWVNPAPTQYRAVPISFKLLHWKWRLRQGLYPICNVWTFWGQTKAHFGTLTPGKSTGSFPECFLCIRWIYSEISEMAFPKHLLALRKVPQIQWTRISCFLKGLWMMWKVPFKALHNCLLTTSWCSRPFSYFMQYLPVNLQATSVRLVFLDSYTVCCLDKAVEFKLSFKRHVFKLV